MRAWPSGQTPKPGAAAAAGLCAELLLHLVVSVPVEPVIRVLLLLRKGRYQYSRCFVHDISPIMQALLPVHEGCLP